MSTLFYTFWDTIVPYRTESVHFFGGLMNSATKYSTRVEILGLRV